MNALNWNALVAEALRRRKAEHMTQKDHAALADVSIPTIVAFDRCEHTLSLGKAFDILRVVGLIEEPVPDDAQDRFVREAFERWQSLTAGLPEDSPARFPHGWYRIDYVLEGTLRDIKPHALPAILDQSSVPVTGWPMFAIMPHSEAMPQEIDGVIECWLKPQGRSRFQDAAHCDFWRADAKGRMFLMRGYQEDSQDTIPPGTIFDTTLPIWRLGEALLHASRLARLLGQDESTIAVRMRVLFTGLTGRVLRAWGNPLSGDFLVGSHPARSDEATSDLVVAARDVDRHLGRHVQALAAPLFERFGIASLSQDGISAELARMQQNVR